MGLTMSDEREGRIRKSVSHYAESIERDPAFREKHGLGPPPEHDDELLLAELDATRARLAEVEAKRAHETQHLLDCCAERDKALAAAEAECVRLREALEDCEDWFGERADADAQGDPMEYVGNAEMHALGRVRRALAATAPGSRKALREKMLVAWMGGAFSGAAWMYAHLGGDEATALAHLNRFQAAAAGTTKAFHDWFASKYDGEEEADG